MAAPTPSAPQASDPTLRSAARKRIRPVRIFTTTAYGYDAFLSYSRRDALEYAATLQTALESSGLTVCRDESDLAPGDTLRPSLRARLRRSRYLILLDTPEARLSTYVKEELEYAIAKSLHIVRITFPHLCKADDPSDLFAPFKEQLLREIWLTDESAAPLRSPESSVLEALRHAHRTRKVRVRFLRLAAAVTSLVAVALAIGAVSAHARHRANGALQSFRASKTSFAEARKRAADLFSSKWFPLHDLFVAEAHWELRNAVATQAIKRSGAAEFTSGPSVAGCGAAALRLPHLEESESCLEYEPRLDEAAFGARRSVVGGREEFRFRLWSRAAGFGEWSDWHPDGQVRRVAIGKSRLATATDAQITMWRRAKDGFPIEGESHAVPAVYDIQFSEDEQLLAVLSKPPSQTPELILLDASTGTVLQQITLAARPGAPAPCPGGALSADGSVFRTCIAGVVEAFETRPPKILARYPTTATPGARVTGAGHGVNGIVYWTWNHQVVVCTNDLACRVWVAPNTTNSEVLRHVPGGALRRAALASPSGESAARFVLLDDGRSVWKCPSAESRCHALGAVPQLQFVNDPVNTVLTATTADVAVPIDVVRPPHPNIELFIAASGNGRLIELGSDGTIRLWQDWLQWLQLRSDITPSEVSRADAHGATLTSAAFSRSAKRIMLTFASSTGSFALLSESRLFPWLPRVWRRYRVRGHILSVRFDEEGAFTTLERWGSEIVKAHYPIGAADVVDWLRQE
jgi:hypothetical protein